MTSQQISVIRNECAKEYMERHTFESLNVFMLSEVAYQLALVNEREEAAGRRFR